MPRRTTAMRRTFSLLCLLLLLGGTNAADLQAANLQLTPGLTLEERYNNNIYFDYNSDDEVHDSITLASPELKLSNRTERLDAYLLSRVTAVRYRQEHDLNATDQSHSGRISYRLSERWQGALEAGYTRDSQPDRDIEVSGLVLSTNKRAHTHYRASTGYTFTEKLSSSISYSYDEDDFEKDDPYTDTNDSTAQNASLVVSHDMGSCIPGTIGQLSLGYARYDYPDERIVNYSAMLGGQYTLSEVFSLMAGAGRYYSRSRFEYDLPFFSLDQTSRSRGNLGRVVLAYHGERATADLGFHHEIRGMSGRVGAARRTALRLNLGYGLNADLWGGITAEYYTNKANAGQLSSDEVDEKTVSVQPRLRYKITEDLSVEAGYRFVQTTDREDDETGRQSVYSLRGVWQYPMPR